MNTQILNETVNSFLIAHPYVIFLILIWTLAWKGLALWKAVKNNHMTVFIILLVLNTAGIGEIIYLVYYYLYLKNKKQVTPEIAK